MYGRHNVENIGLGPQLWPTIVSLQKPNLLTKNRSLQLGIPKSETDKNFPKSLSQKACLAGASALPVKRPYPKRKRCEHLANESFERKLGEMMKRDVEKRNDLMIWKFGIWSVNKTKKNFKMIESFRSRSAGIRITREFNKNWKSANSPTTASVNDVH